MVEPKEDMIPIFYLVFSQLAVGGFALLLIIPNGLVGRGFYRLMGGIYLLTVVLARCANLAINREQVNFKNFCLAWEGQDSLFTLLLFLILLGYMVSLWRSTPLIHRLLLFAGTGLGLIWIVFSTQRYLKHINLPAEELLLPLQFIASTILLGAVNSGMWFGHWYLVTPRLPISYLKRFNQLFISSLSLSIFFFALNLWFRAQAAEAIPLTLFDQIILGIRLIVGFGGSLLLYFIVRDCLSDKSVEHDAVGATRAATGFLYIAIVTVFMGEFCGRFLLLKMGFIL